MSDNGNNNQTKSFEDSDKKLKKHLSLTQLLFLGVSAQIGSGWLFAVLAAAGVAGPAAIASWFIAGVMVFFISLSYLELGSMLPRTGGIVRYSFLSHGSFTGWIIAWAYWLSAFTIPPLEAEAVLTYLGGQFPATGFLTTANGIDMLSWPNGIIAGIVLMIIFFCLNYFGVKLLASVNTWITLWKIALPTATFVALFFTLDASNFQLYGGFTSEGIAPIFHAITTTGIIFSLLGFRQALDYGGEAKNPQRNIPIATFGSILIPVIIYILLQIAFIGAIQWSSMGLQAGQWTQLISGGWADEPLYHALTSANIAALGALGTLLIIDAAVSPSGSGWVYMGTATRTGYGMAVHNSIPKIFKQNNKFGIPWLPLVVSAAVGCVFFVPTPSWYKLVGFISTAAVLTYIMGGAGLPVLRRTASSLERPFRLSAAWIWAPVSFLAAVEIMYWAGFTTLTNVITATFIGVPVYSAYVTWKNGWMSRVRSIIISIVFFGAWLYVAVAGDWVMNNSPLGSTGWPFALYFGLFCFLITAYCAILWFLSNEEGRRHINAAWWLIWLLLASMLIAYLGDFGPMDDPVLAFPWGMIVELAVGIIAYYWAAKTGFATNEIKEIVESHENGDNELTEAED